MGKTTALLSKRLRAIRAVLAHRDFRLFSIGNFMSLTAIWIVRICAAWLTWELTRSKVWLGIIAFAELGPSILVSLYAGPLADRRDKFDILRLGQWFQVVLALGLAALTLTGAMTIWTLLATMAGFSIIGGLTLPARLSVAPMLVEKPQLATASAIGSMTLNVTRLLGPVIAAPMIVASYEGLAFALAALGFAVNAYCLAAIHPDRSRALPAASQDSAGYAALSRVFAQDRRLARLLILQFLLWLSLRPLYDLLPAFSDQVFNAGERGYATMLGAVGLGAVAGAFFATGQEDDAGMDRVVLAGALIAALAMASFGQVTQLWLGLLLLALHGGAVTAAGIAATTFIQMQTPKDKLGRTMSLYALIFRLAPALGALLYGLAADRIGLPMATLAFAGLAALATWLFRQQIRVTGPTVQ